MMIRQRGQLWSLDVVLAAVLFTLAMGLIISQTELNVFNSQQERNMRELHTMALLASTSLTSSPEILITSPSPSSKVENIRCGPNPNGWSYDYDLSWMPNCIVNRPGTLIGESLGLPAGFSVRVEAHSSGSPLSFSSSAKPAGVPYVSITRRLLVLAANSGTNEFHACLQSSSCLLSMQDIIITVWRSS